MRNHAVHRVCVVASLCGIGLFVCLATWARVYWGYFLLPPGVDESIAHLTGIVAIEEYHSSPDAQIEPVPIPQSKSNRQADMSEGVHPENRVLDTLVRAGVRMPTTTKGAPKERRALIAELGLGADMYHGRIVVGQNVGGEAILVLSGSSYPLDHRRYTEAVVAIDSAGRLKKLLSLRQFNYDVAGLEWLTPKVLYVVGAACLLFGLAVAGGLVWIYGVVRKPSAVS